MLSELLDVVDQNDRLTGKQCTRAEAHSKGIWHRTVHIYVYRVKSKRVELLVHLRSSSKDLDPAKWDTRFGGHVLAGQSVQDACNKELEEEIGITLKSDDFINLGVQKYSKGTNAEFSYRFGYEFQKSIRSLHFNDGEVQRVKWMSIEKILESLASDPKKWTTIPKTVQFIGSSIGKHKKLLA